MLPKRHNEEVSKMIDGGNPDSIRPKEVGEAPADGRPPGAPVSSAEASLASAETAKIAIFLRPIGDAPALKKQKFKLDGSKNVFDVEKFLRKSLTAAGSNEVANLGSLVLYCGSGFSPTPDQLVNDLYASFQIGGELVISYSLQETWG
jgi:ubiquitin-like protein ATG12